MDSTTVDTHNCRLFSRIHKGSFRLEVVRQNTVLEAIDCSRKLTLGDFCDCGLQPRESRLGPDKLTQLFPSHPGSFICLLVDVPLALDCYMLSIPQAVQGDT
jgi:hypothetical protein